MLASLAGMTVRPLQSTRLDVTASRLRWEDPLAVRTCYSHLEHRRDAL